MPAIRRRGEAPLKSFTWIPLLSETRSLTRPSLSGLETGSKPFPGEITSRPMLGTEWMALIVQCRAARTRPKAQVAADLDAPPPSIAVFRARPQLSYAPLAVRPQPTKEGRAEMAGFLFKLETLEGEPAEQHWEDRPGGGGVGG